MYAIDVRPSVYLSQPDQVGSLILGGHTVKHRKCEILFNIYCCTKIIFVCISMNYIIEIIFDYVQTVN